MAVRRTHARKRTIRHNPVRRIHHRRRRSNPSHSNPGGISGIVMNGLWVGVGMWAGGMVNSLIGGITGSVTGMLGPLGGIAQGLINAYAVAWIASRTVGHGELMAAGAFAGTAMGAISGVIGGAGSLVSGLTGALTGGGAPNPTGVPDTVVAPTTGSQQQPLRIVSGGTQ